MMDLKILQIKRFKLVLQILNQCQAEEEVMYSTVYPKIKSGQLLNSAVFHWFVVFWASILSCSSPCIFLYSLKDFAY